MPQKDTAPEPMVCDGCAQERYDVESNSDTQGYQLCAVCSDLRADDPVVTIHGRTLLASEVEMQAKSDKDLKAAMAGDSYTEQLKAGKR